MKYAFLTLMVGLALGLAACGNTVNGMGRDIEKAGQSMQRYN